MRQFHYILQTLLHSRGNNSVKLLSLTLGLTVGILLFSQIVYELNYDTFYREPEQLTMFGNRYIKKTGEITDWEYDTFRPAAAALMESLPEAVECATPFLMFHQPDLYKNDQKLTDTQTLFGDTLYFRTMGIDVLEGDPHFLAQKGSVFLSRRKAREWFGEEDPIGKTLNMDKSRELTVRGIYEDIPGNVLFRHNLVISLPTIEESYGEGTWYSNDMYMVYVRLRQGADLDRLNARMSDILAKYTAVKDRWDGSSLEGQLLPATDFYLSHTPNVQRLVILFVLGIAIFFVSGMNYVLAAIATLGRRAKLVGVHKCCGAEAGHILGLFLTETALLLGIALAGSIALLYLFSEPIEDLTGIYRLSELFTPASLWVPLATVGVLFLLAGVLPGRMFARIPVTQVFRRYTEDKRSWKRGLLCVQFVGISFILGLLLTSAWQFHQLMTLEVGFRTDRLVVGTARAGFGNYGTEFAEGAQRLADALRRQPFVEEVGVSEQSLLTHYSSQPMRVQDSEAYRLLHFQYLAKGCPQAVGMELVQGRWPEHEGEALVTENLVKNLNWGEQALGHELNNVPAARNVRDAEAARVVGIIRDVRNLGFFQEKSNVAFILSPNYAATFHVRLKAPGHENLLRLNQFVKESYPQLGLTFLSYEDVRREQNESVSRFRNIVSVTSLCILFIVLTGLIGYVSDETQRRSKEIAIRKVNGAEAADILRLLAVGILKVAVGAVVFGTTASYYVSGLWMEQFPDGHPLSVGWFLILTLLILVLIVLTVIGKAWHIANENPVLSLKSE